MTAHSHFFRNLHRAPWVAALVIFALAFPLFLTLHLNVPLVHDSDSYYHDAVASAYAREGFFNELAWARFSAMATGFGDKEFLFHLLLMPLSGLPGQLGMKIALAFFNALLAAVAGYLGIRAVGLPGALVPLFLFGTSTDFMLRMTALRPEIFSVTLLLAASWTAARRRYLLYFFFCALFALSHTPFHVLIGLTLLWFVAVLLTEGKADWRLLGSGFAGVGAGLALHPHFPSNVSIWAVQNITFFRQMHLLDVGSEFRPHTTKAFFLFNLGWLFSLAAMRRTAAAKEGLDDLGERPRSFFIIGAFAFSLLYLFMQRFSTFAIPFVTLALLFDLRHRGMALGRFTRLPFGIRIPAAAALVVCLLFSIPALRYVHANLVQRGAFTPAFLDDWKAVGKVLPPGAKVAAPWRDAALYVRAAPQAFYLNLLDPVFMATPHPREEHLQREIWKGLEPDVPLAAVSILDSGYLAFQRTYRELADRLDDDPRLEPLHRGGTIVYRILAGANSSFLFPSSVAPPLGPAPPGRGPLPKGFTAYPRASEPRAALVEGYVDGTRAFPDARALDFFFDVTVESPVEIHYEFSPWGAGQLWHNDRLLLTVRTPLKAVLGRGAFLPLRLEEGTHRLAIRTEKHDGRIGFYLRERGRQDISGE